MPPQAYFPLPMKQHVIEIQPKLTNKGEKKGNKQIEWYLELENLGLNCTLSFKTVNPELF